MGAASSPRVPLPTALYRRETWIAFFVLLVGASVNAGEFPGQLLALPAYLPMVALDAFEAASGVSLGDAWGVVLVAAYYVLAVAIGSLYLALRDR